MGIMTLFLDRAAHAAARGALGGSSSPRDFATARSAHNPPHTAPKSRQYPMQRPLLLARGGARGGRVGEHTPPVGEHHLRERRARAKERLSVCGDGAPLGQRARLRYQRGGARAHLGGVLRAEVRAPLGALDRVEQLLR